MDSTRTSWFYTFRFWWLLSKTRVTFFLGKTCEITLFLVAFHEDVQFDTSRLAAWERKIVELYWMIVYGVLFNMQVYQRTLCYKLHFICNIAGSTIRTLLHGKINPKNLLFFLVVSSDYGKPRIVSVHVENTKSHQQQQQRRHRGPPMSCMSGPRQMPASFGGPRDACME